MYAKTVHTNELSMLLPGRQLVLGWWTACLFCVTVNQSEATPYYLFDGYAHLAAGLSCGLAGLAAGMAIGIVGDAGVRQVSDCCLLYAALVDLAGSSSRHPCFEF